MNKTEQQDKGFTLIELLIVIVILGVLAAVIVFRVANVTDSAESNACEIEVRAVRTAVQAFKADTGAYPTAIADLVGEYLEEAPSATTAIGGTGTYTAATGTFTATC
ncbi:MAG: hypothetical protein RLZ04_1496 [Actinomycetota bacterium]